MTYIVKGIGKGILTYEPIQVDINYNTYYVIVPRNYNEKLQTQGKQVIPSLETS